MIKLFTKDSLKIHNNMVKENGMQKMDNIMKDSLFKAKRKDLGYIILILLKSIKESLRMIFLMEKESCMIKIICLKGYGLEAKILSYSKFRI
jgi:hypothetical protein